MSSKALAILHMAGLGIRFIFLLFLVKHDLPAVLGLYSIVSTIETIGVYVFGFEMHTFTGRRYARNPSRSRLAVLQRTHAHLLKLTLPMIVVVVPVVMWLLSVASEVVAVGAAVVIVAAAAILQETTRMTVLLNKPHASVQLTFFRSYAWHLISIALIAGTRISPVTAIFIPWMLSALACATYSLSLAEFRKIPSGRINWRYIRHGIFKARDYYFVAAANSVQQSLDRIIVQSLLGSSVLGIYTFFQSLASSIGGIVQSAVTNKYMMGILRAYTKPGPESRNLTRTVARKSLFCAALVGLALILAYYPMARVLNKPYVLSSFPIFLMILCAQLLLAWSQPYHLALYASHFDKLLRNIGLVSIIISLAGGVALAKLFGLVGVAMSVFGVALFLARMKYHTFKTALEKAQ
ncbi:hypothetical protein GCM10027321_17930 [Massilia terrae]|uniref:Polysaccharide biosynthesis protein n=1 Tax=Massilia terrae TaxID=1811224 RepID=A0ABT2CVZ5_9BURK|nr:hypothetical protein [Massilia terrae]MCS0658137.1 hypothetical protein [Massilia terrae]